MQYVFYILIGILILVIWSMYHEMEVKKRVINRLKEDWAIPSEEEITSEKLDSIKSFYNTIKDEKLDVDDITWNDLDMDEIYLIMNNTQSSIGEEYLYALLHKPCFSQKELKERNRLMDFFATSEEQRIKVQSKLYSIGKLSRISVHNYITKLDEQEPKSNLSHYLMAFGLILSVILIFIKPAVGGALTVLFVGFNIFQYYKSKAEIENYLMVVSYLCRLLDGIKELHHLKIPELSYYTDLLKEDGDQFKKFRRDSAFVAPKQASGNLEDIILDYVRMLFHIDLIKYNTLLRNFKNKRQALDRIFINVGFLDSMIAAASFRSMLPFYCEPELEKSKKPYLNAVDLYHPLIEEPVSNSIKESGSVLITGSNASGKSTFIKTLAINAILSQTIYTSTSKKYKSSFFMIYSSMALRDNIFSKESYYMVEIKSLKRILDRLNDEVPILCFIDEVLRGTNTLERIAASSRILSYLARRNAFVFAATHDIELTHILEQDYSNYHFQERIAGNEILFDYKLYQGKAISKNAIKLLDMLQFPKEITKASELAAEEFLSTGEWSNMK